ncbi:MAG: dockerin type I repeat-containing protein [Bacteroidota bacterium]
MKTMVYCCMIGIMSLLTFSFHQAKAQPYSLKLETVYVCPGTSTVAVSMTIQCNEGISAMSLKSNFNISNLTYIGTTYVNPKFSKWSKPDTWGILRYANTQGTPMGNVSLKLLKNGIQLGQTMTDVNGYFKFYITQAALYMLVPLCTKPWGGGNSVDALTVLKHYTGQVSLNGIYLQAADVDNSGFVNSNDAFLIAKRHVGLISQFPMNNWIFSNTSIVINDNQNHTLSPLGICAGDVNGSYIP